MPTNIDGLPIFSRRSPVGRASSSARTQFYREELVKHWECLEQQREYYSEKAITDVEGALTRLIADVDELCARKNGDQLVSSLLRKIDGVTRLSAWFLIAKRLVSPKPPLLQRRPRSGSNALSSQSIRSVVICEERHVDSDLPVNRADATE